MAVSRANWIPAFAGMTEMNDGNIGRRQFFTATQGNAMITIVFRSRLKPDADLTELEALVARMAELAAAMPGFVSYKDYGAEDGETLSLVEFESLESLAAWRDHPEHREAQQRGREEFFAEYHIQVCETLRAYAFPQGS
jgi:heme-degrading monooxygenase HmoA